MNDKLNEINNKISHKLSDKMHDISLGDAIENLAQKRHVLTDTALRAKERFDEEQALRHSHPTISKKQSNLIEEFSHSVDLLAAIFQKSRFDEAASFIANPSRMMILNLVVSIVRGVGFGIGLLFVAFCLIMVFKDSLSGAQFLSLFLSN